MPAGNSYGFPAPVRFYRVVLTISRIIGGIISCERIIKFINRKNQKKTTEFCSLGKRG